MEHYKPRVEPLEHELGPPPKPSIQDAPKLELKTLPSHLRYTFLGTNDTLPIILSVELSDIHVDATLRILTKRKMAIGWKMDDIYGTSPTLCSTKFTWKKIINRVRNINTD